MKAIELVMCLVLVGCSSVSLVDKITQTDSFLWLEEIESPKSLDWVQSNNRRTVARYSTSKDFNLLKSRILGVLQADDRIPYVFEQNGYLYNFWQDKKHIAGLLRRTTTAAYEANEAKWESVFDLDAFNSKEQKKWVWKGMRCLGRSNHCILRLSPGGGDAVWVKEFDLAEAKFVKNGFEFPIAKTQVEWVDADTLWVGTDFGPGSLTDSGYPRIIKSIKRGQMLEEAKVLIEGQKKDVSVSVDIYYHTDVRSDGQVEHRFMTLSRNTSFYSSLKYVVGDDNLPSELSFPTDSEIVGIYKGQIVLNLKSEWNKNGEVLPAGSVVSVSRDDTNGPVSILMKPTFLQVVERTHVSQNQVFLEVLDNVEGKIFAADWDSKWSLRRMKTPDGGAISLVTKNESSPLVYAAHEDYLNPTILLKVQSERKSGGQIDFLKQIRQVKKKFESDGYISEKRFATSKDGTKIPFTVVRPTVQKKPLPTLLYGYGGFEISLDPSYNAVVGKAWLEEGNVYVVANIRGGGEYGPSWHKAALKQNRQKSFEDFEAVADELVRSGVTTSKQLGIKGGSNGGLLVGAAMTRRPSAYAAVICEVPLLDMIRYHKLLAGASWVEEYGNPEDPEDFDYLLSSSPYHQLQSGKYPEAFIFTSTKDDRVHPGHARKFVAKLQELKSPVVYYENLEGGHARAADLQQSAFIQALEYAYLKEKLTK